MSLLPRENPNLFGHGEAVAQLWRDYASGKPAHGILIAGPKGIGKATLAYRFARAVLKGSDDMYISPDDPIFRRIAAGSHADLLVIEQEYDPKKEEFKNEISVEQAREIAQFLSLTPGEGQWRIVIIDAIDALNNNAANAILKILEEPPPQALLLLVSHNPGRLLPTIRSRCRMLKLAPLMQDDFRKALRHTTPALETSQINALSALSAGAPGLAAELEEQEAVALYEQILALAVTLPQIDTLKLLAFAEQIGSGQVHRNWHCATRLMLTLLERITQQASGRPLSDIIPSEQATLSSLARLHPAGIWAGKWQQAAEQFSVAERLHLDYKTVIIAFFHSIASREHFSLSTAA